MCVAIAAAVLRSVEVHCASVVRDVDTGGVWDRSHRTVLDAFAQHDLLDVSSVVLESAHVRAKKGAYPGPSPADRGEPGSKMHVLSNRRGVPVVVAVPRGNEYDSHGLKPVITVLVGRASRGSCTLIKRMTGRSCGDGHTANASEYASP